ncbi:ribosome-inactivating family protein [Streptomyces sp. NPDC059003]|uniref:ribosome-inactivating family protein n=1 Tax=Streptomyces sp. NPDC059003 TaxID=3346691 RepID=UPI0036768D27
MPIFNVAGQSFPVEEYKKFIKELRSQYNQGGGGLFPLSFKVNGKEVNLWFDRANLYLEGWNVGGTYFHFSGASVPPGFKGEVKGIGFGGNYDALGRKGPGNTLGESQFADSLNKLSKADALVGKGFPKSSLADLIQMGPEMARFGGMTGGIEKYWSPGSGGWKVSAEFFDATKNWEAITKLAGGKGKPVTIGGTALSQSKAEEVLGDGVRWRGLTEGEVSNKAAAYGVRAAAKIPAACRGKIRGKSGGQFYQSTQFATGAVACMSLDWQGMNRELQAEADELVRAKVSMSQGKEIKITPEIQVAARESNAFFVPYEKTRGALANEFKLKAGARVGAAVGSALWIAGVVNAFSHDTSALDKAAALTAPVPVLGNLLGIVNSIDSKDITGTTVNAGMLLAELAEILGVSEAGPVGLFIGGMITVASMGHRLEEDFDAVVKQRNKIWSENLRKQLEELATSGSGSYAELYFEFLKGQALQSATVRWLTALAEARATTAQGTEPDDEHVADVLNQLEAQGKFRKTDGEVRESVQRTGVQLRNAVTEMVKKAEEKAWKSSQEEFNEPFVSRVEALRKASPPDNATARGVSVGWRLKQEKLADEARKELEKQPPGLTDAEISDILDQAGWPPALQQGPRLRDADCSIAQKYGSVRWDLPRNAPNGLQMEVAPGNGESHWFTEASSQYINNRLTKGDRLRFVDKRPGGYRTIWSTWTYTTTGWGIFGKCDASVDNPNGGLDAWPDTIRSEVGSNSYTLKDEADFYIDVQPDAIRRLDSAVWHVTRMKDRDTVTISWDSVAHGGTVFLKEGQIAGAPGEVSAGNSDPAWYNVDASGVLTVSAGDRKGWVLSAERQHVANRPAKQGTPLHFYDQNGEMLTKNNLPSY